MKSRESERSCFLNSNAGKITKIDAREIIDCRGWPTIQADVWVEGGLMGRADVPSGRSTGSNEAHVLLDGDMGRLTAFRDTIQKHLAPFGVKEEKRPFKPHLTLGRFRKKPNQPDLDEALSRWQDLSSQACDLKELILFKSDLMPSGAVHTRLNTWSLTGNR